MIRRNPTLIPMSDADVQDVRDMVAREKAENHPAGAGMSEESNAEFQQQLPSESKEKRLGLK